MAPILASWPARTACHEQTEQACVMGIMEVTRVMRRSIDGVLPLLETN